MSQHLGLSPKERVTPIAGLPMPIDAPQRLVPVVTPSGRASRFLDTMIAVATPQRIAFSVLLGLLTLLLIRGVDIRISEITIHLGR